MYKFHRDMFQIFFGLNLLMIPIPKQWHIGDPLRYDSIFLLPSIPSLEGIKVRITIGIVGRNDNGNAERKQNKQQRFRKKKKKRGMLSKYGITNDTGHAQTEL